MIFSQMLLCAAAGFVGGAVVQLVAEFFARRQGRECERLGAEWQSALSVIKRTGSPVQQILLIDGKQYLFRVEKLKE